MTDHKARHHLCVIPLSLKDANRFVESVHRHHPPVPVHRFSIGVLDGDELAGVAICNVPSSYRSNDGLSVEVTRLATNGARNACSILYGACRRAAFAMGYRRILTYTLPAEGGASLKASGWTMDGLSVGTHRYHAKERGLTEPAPYAQEDGKFRWVALNPKARQSIEGVDFGSDDSLDCQPGLFDMLAAGSMYADDSQMEV